ncbi:hypothetical protein CONPUDRAFT_125977 [Coniophora puteana RWD-64-598 SS2]|uniref:RING-type domain-containing protein n=1 Tax=Coniophora puteana (strain RWD-64-598) TaxID=741705 RepID=A0A5M3MKK3_CONPW|nr:uncharacterized protein CONPUDRAFT_125977 [Coniophora puteana RWD-64-598 SS2]EIW79613.1 hypothetical protein CONPUDRAFT_125977 [Coniophora puteana RWD-64-598 SS2]
MTKHSKNNTASSVFSYAEKQKTEYGSKRQRLGNESMRNFDACALCLQRAREPVACNEGHLFCKECVYTDLLTQKNDIKKQKARLEKLKQEAEEEKERAKEEARERVLQDFEKRQLGLGTGGTSKGATPSGADKEGGESRGLKRKLDFGTSTVETLTREAEEAALRQIEKEQAEALKHKLPDFWLPSLTPTYSSNGAPSSLKDVKLQTTCRGGNPPHPLALKALFPVKFSALTNGSVKSPDATPSENGKARLDEEQFICTSCKSNLTNHKTMFVMKPCSHVVCKTCTDSLVRPAKQCIVCDIVLKDKDIIGLKREGTGFAGGGIAETSTKGVAFQG